MKAAASTCRSPCRRSSWRSVAPSLRPSWCVRESLSSNSHRCFAEMRQLGAAGDLDAEAAEHQVQLWRLSSASCSSSPHSQNWTHFFNQSQRSLKMFLIVYLLPTNVYVSMSYNPVTFFNVWSDFVRWTPVMYSFHWCVHARLIRTSPCGGSVCLHPSQTCFCIKHLFSVKIRLFTEWLSEKAEISCCISNNLCQTVFFFSDIANHFYITVYT